MKYILFLILTVSSAYAQIAYPPDSIFHLSNVPEQTNNEFKKLVENIAEERWRKNEHSFVVNHFHDNYVSISENGRIRTKKQVLSNRTDNRAAATIKEAALTGINTKIEKLVAQVYGDAAVVHYLIDMRLKLNNLPVYKLFRCTDVFLRSNNIWKVVSHSETVIPGSPTGVKVDSTIYRDYIGDYHLAPVVTYTVSGRDGRLYWGKNQQTELIPESETVFSFKLPITSNSPNSSYRIRFVRDDKRKVTHLHFIEYPGVEYDAIKVQQ